MSSLYVPAGCYSVFFPSHIDSSASVYFSLDLKVGELNHINSVKFEFGDCSIHHYEISRVKWSYRQFQLSRDHISVKCV